MIEWTEVDKTEAQRKDVIVHRSGVSSENFDDKGLPTDIHLVRYDLDGKTYCDAVRANKKSDIFDVYYDKITPKGGKVIDIKCGYGNIRPNLWKGDEDKSKSKT